MTLYGQEEDGSDKVEELKYTVSNGKASVTYNDKKIETSAIKDDAFTASLDGTEKNTCTFSTTQGKKYQKPTSDPDTTNPFSGKTFYGSMTTEAGKYDVCKLEFTSETDVTMTLYGQGENGADKVEKLKYTVSNGKASVTYNDNKIETSVIKDDAFTASLDGTEENACSFSTVEGTKYQGPILDPDPTPDPEPNPTPTNPFAGKTFYGSYTFDEKDIKGTFDVEEIRFKDAELTWISYGGNKDGSDDYEETVPYTVADGKATMKIDVYTITTSVIINDKFTVTYGEGEEGATISYSRIQGIRISDDLWTEDPNPPTTEIKTAVQFSGSIGNFDLEWKNGVAVVEKDLIALYADDWNNNSDSTISFALLTVKGDWDEPCYKATAFNFDEETNLKIDASDKNNVVTSTDSLAGKKIRLTFTGTKETIKCKAEIVGVSDTLVLPAVQFCGSIGDFDLKWTDGVAVVEKELEDSYVDGWNKDSVSTISFALLTVKDKWLEPCYKATMFNFDKEEDLKIAKDGNNIVTSEDALAGKKIKLTFTKTEKTIKCKAEIVE